MLFNRLIALTIFITVIPYYTNLVAGDSFSGYLKQNKDLVNRSFQGTDYWLTVLPGYAEGPMDSGLVKIYIISGIFTEATVEVPGKGFMEVKPVNPKKCTVFELPAKTACPWIKNAADSSPAEMVYRQAGIHVYSNTSIIVFVEYSANKINESYLALPVSSLGNEYIVSSYISSSYGGLKLPSLTACVSLQDENVVKFLVGGNVITKTTGGMKPGQEKTEVLNRGDVWIFGSDEKDQDISGSRWSSSKPLGVVSGNYGALIPMNSKGLNYITEMELPTNLWGNNYPVPIIPGKSKPPIVKIVAKEEKTRLYRNNIDIAMLVSSGGLIDKGWLGMRLLPDQEETAPAIISGDKPINLTMYNTGSGDDNTPAQKIEPFSLNIAPSENFINRATLNVSNIGGKQTKHYINLVYKVSDSNSINEILINRPIDNPDEWNKLTDLYPGEGSAFPVKIGGFDYFVKNFELADTGVYRIKALTEFAAYLYGYKENGISYANPAAAWYFDFDQPDTFPPVPAFEYCRCCGKTDNAKVRDMPEDSEVRTNLAFVYFDSEHSFNYRFNHDDFIPGKQQEIAWNLEVIDLGKDAKAVITFTDRAGNDTTVELNYFARKLGVYPLALDLGYIVKGKDTTGKIILTNPSNTYPLDIYSTDLKFKNTGFSLVTPNLPFRLMPKEEVGISFKFKSDILGDFYDTLMISDSCGINKKITLKAKVVSVLIRADDNYFKRTKVGESESKTMNIYNAGSYNLIITGYSGNFSQYFTHNLGNISKDNPIIIPPGNEPYKFSVTFKPTAEGVFKDSVLFESNSEPTGDNVAFFQGSTLYTGTDDDIQYSDIVSAAPNPAGDFLNISVNSETGGVAEISVYSMQGILLGNERNFNLEQGMNIIKYSLNDLASGNYYLVVRNGININRVKFSRIK